MKVSAERINDQFLMETKGASGVSVYMDHSGMEKPQGASPMEMLLMSVGGCSAIDIIDILKKQRQQIDSYKFEVEGDREPLKEAKVFKTMHVKVFLEGHIAPAKALRAAELSFEKYCSVVLTMEPNVKVSYEVILNGETLQ